MEESTAGPMTPPYRITDLVKLKEAGAYISCSTAFEVVPVDFQHRTNPFQAYIFICRFTGSVNDQSFSFRKCYARGCPNNLCPHVAQAVMIANRYLQRDYQRLLAAGINVDTSHVFSLEEMLSKFHQSNQDSDDALVIHDYVRLVEKHGLPVDVTVETEFVPAAEHFVNETRSTIFLMVRFHITCEGKPCSYERCLACYPKDEEGERPNAVEIANQRLRILYADFDRVGIAYTPRYF